MDNSCSFKPASPAAPAAQWIGGKRHLAPRICALIESTPHRVYAEPFVGMGGVFLRRAMAAQVEAINDRDGEVANLFRVLQRHFSPLMELLQWQVASRAEFQRLAAQDPTLLTDLERAARFLYLQRLAYGGKVRGRSFGIDTLRSSDFNVGKLRDVLQAIHERLAGVTIDCLDWSEFLERWDRDETLFYLDPPYYGVETYYAAKFPRADHERLAGALAGLKGQFILSMNDLPQTRAIYGAFPFETVRMAYTAGGGRQAVKDATEILVTKLRSRAQGTLL
jgi:DNA adenine methylase